MLRSSSEKVPGPHNLHSVLPSGPHWRTAPSPRVQCEQGAHTPTKSKKKKPSSHSHCVFWTAEQGASVGILAGHLEQGEHWPRPSDDEKVPVGGRASVRKFLLDEITPAFYKESPKIGIKGPVCKTCRFSKETAASSCYVIDCSTNPIVSLLLSLPVNYIGINHLILGCFLSELECFA